MKVTFMGSLGEPEIHDLLGNIEDWCLIHATESYSGICQHQNWLAFAKFGKVCISTSYGPEVGHMEQRASLELFSSILPRVNTF